MNWKTKLFGLGLGITMLLLGTGAGYRSAPDLAYEVENEEELILKALREAGYSDWELGLEERTDTASTGEECPLDPDGSALSASGGVNYYFDQKETYYNLNMDGVVALARSLGIEGEYWVRSDGCKMLGDYIMIAANLDVHPRGSLVATSLGLGIVVDTGGFASANPTQVDIAVNW